MRVCRRAVCIPIYIVVRVMHDSPSGGYKIAYEQFVATDGIGATVRRELEATVPEGGLSMAPRSNS